ncbi:GNAT family N-acetyltransferase [Chelativorans salis]|uniref:GNAT family N-acetyltransferase n=1 Tax=Chelativorans salis TaxID=2978478 RepID=A0ABT2LJ39_9HYPH|nr:GNAT family N-acetyltransferase [Chelativorans sp. EGI FJ00035]MCT7374334.1 GNAT family N-acetyltransferase [Chelativorans sp. EGI FJ00035]
MTSLCLRAKAVHGYDEAFIEACRNELTVDPTSSGLVVAEDGAIPVGLAEVVIAGERAELEKLFVEPECHGRGLGRRLFEWAKAEAKSHGACEIVIDSDPGAAAFYERMGAAVMGQSPSGSIAGRLLPRLRLPLELG